MNESLETGKLTHDGMYVENRKEASQVTDA